MAMKIGGAARLAPPLAGVLMLVGAQGASAGLIATADLLPDFRFDGGAVNYYPSYRDLTVAARNESGPAARKGGGGSGGFPASGSDPSGFLYLTPEVASAGGDSGKMGGVGELASASAATVSELLAGALRKMGVDSGPARFDFLVREGTVGSGLMSEDAGPQVYAKVAGLAGNDWMGVYSSLASPASASAAARGPAIPVPATLALFLVAGVIPLIGSRRR